MTTEQKFKESYYFNDFDTKIEGNLYNNISIPINTEEKQNEDNNIHGELFPFIFEEDNNGGLFSIKKNLLLSDKKNENSPNNIENHNNNDKDDSIFTGKKNIKSKRIHNKFEKDNIMKKINIHFISFIVKFVNFNIKTLISKKHPLFANLSYNFKKKLNNYTFKELSNMSIGEVLRNEGSNKNKRNIIYEKDENKKIFKSVHETILKDLLDINYIQFFRHVYMKAPKKYTLEVLNNYKTPKKIVFFDDFVKSEVQKDKINGELYKEKLIYISRSEFLNNYPYFETQIIK